MEKSKPETPEHGQQTPRKRRWWPIIKRLSLVFSAVVALWCVWIDFEVRRDFEALQWVLPARLYARPAELYVGAPISQAELSDYLEHLGYRVSTQVEGPGEYQRSPSRIRLWTRGFDFWDGAEPSLYLNVEFEGRKVRALWGDQDTGDIALVRLEPAEIAQINPTTGEDRVPVRLSDVPQALIDAVIAVEDQRFFSHFGVDPVGIGRALVANLRAGSIVQGGSTLTQQLIKNLYLSRQQTLRRKIEEALMALALELHFSKEQILEAYMNEVFLGQQGNRAIHGFALASEYYFSRPLSELSLSELATLAGLPRGASYYNPRRYPERATQRRDIVLARMLSQGYIDAQQRDQASSERLKVAASAPSRGKAYPAFMELVRENLARDYDREALQTEGLRIFTTLDLRVQDLIDANLEAAVKSVERASANGSDGQLEAAVVISDAITGEVRGIAGGRQRGYAGFNRALNARRPIGSLVKPAIYLAALESGQYSLASVLADQPISVPLSGSQVWSPKNYDDKLYGDVYLFDALERSMNLATVDLGMQLGLDSVARMLKNLGYSEDIPLYPSLLLGAIDMAPIEVAQLYQTLASNGFRSPLRAVEAVTTGQGARLERYGIETEQVSDPESMYLLEYALQGVFNRGTAKSVTGRMEDSLPLAGKTGTTNDLRDSWFAGYGDDLVGVVWLGYDDNRDTGLTGATGALRVWSELMSDLNVKPRLTLPPAKIVWQDIASQATRQESERDCRATLALPFMPGRLPNPAVSCEDSESFLQNIFDRMRGVGQ
jgi:penicillin-binding protein 1B